MPRADRKKSYRYGLAAEKLAALYLRCKGYRIIAGRHLRYGGEIDLIARRGSTIAIVEVKARKSFVDCAYSVPPWKQQKIARAASGLAAANLAGLADIENCNMRFDVIWVAGYRLPLHIKDAWRL